MALFSVTRYDETKDDDQKDPEDKKLLKVLKKIEKRKINRMKNKLKKGAKTTLKTAEPLEEKLDKPEEESKVDNSEEHDETMDTNNVEETTSETPKDDPSKETTQNEFIILGSDIQKEQSKVKRILPGWLLNPTIIQGSIKDNLMPVSKIEKLCDDMRENLDKNKITELFPVQATVVPYLIQASYDNSSGSTRRDVCVSAPTGSGKTLAYIIPIVNDIITSYYLENKIRALIILPTQSLAAQIYEQFKLYTTFKNFNVDIGLVTGSTSLAQEQRQIICNSHTWGPSSKVHILVCTPGRLVEHLKFTEGFDLTDLEYLVIDEADRVLDSIQDDWLYHLEKHLKEQVDKNFNKSLCNMSYTKDLCRPQRLLFSATLSQDPEQLEKLHLHQPLLFTTVGNETNDAEETDLTQIKGKYTMPSELTEKYIVSSLEMKPLVLYKYIKDENLKKVLVFTNTVSSVHRLRILLKALAPELNVREISSKLTIKKKRRLMKIYDTGVIDVLVCTDSMARGIDFPNVQAVFSYTAPKFIKTYIHRVGRTARAGMTGTAITILEPPEKGPFLKKLNDINKTDIDEIKINMEELYALNDMYSSALEKLRVQLAKEEEIAQLQIKKQTGLIKKNQKRGIKNKNKDDKNSKEDEVDGKTNEDDIKTDEDKIDNKDETDEIVNNNNKDKKNNDIKDQKVKNKKKKIKVDNKNDDEDETVEKKIKIDNKNDDEDEIVEKKIKVDNKNDNVDEIVEKKTRNNQKRKLKTNDKKVKKTK